jgi:hypothetical protein
MKEEYVECADLSGKTIRALRIYKDTGDGTEIQIELTDGTFFSCCVSHTTTVIASYYNGGIGSPEILHNYEV